MEGVIYVITNNINGKQYVGKTTKDPDKYWRWHKNQANRGVKKVLYKSIRKYGEGNYTFEVIKRIKERDSRELNEKLNKLEIEYIKALDTLTPKGYNVTLGGDGALGVRRSEEFKNNLRQIKTGVPKPEWVKEKMRIPKSEEHKENLRIPKTEEHKEKLREVWGEFSDEEKRRIANKGIRSRRCYKGENNPFYGKEHTDSFKKWIKDHNTELQNREDVKRNNKIKQPHRVAVNMISLENGEVVESFITITDAKRWVFSNTKYKGDVGTISKAVKSNKTAYGYKWEEKIDD